MWRGDGGEVKNKFHKFKHLSKKIIIFKNIIKKTD
jgi:hypothetical protein